MIQFVLSDDGHIRSIDTSLGCAAEYPKSTAAKYYHKSRPFGTAACWTDDGGRRHWDEHIIITVIIILWLAIYHPFLISHAVLSYRDIFPTSPAIRALITG